MKKIRIACVGAGYFAPFHVDGWKRIPEVDLIAICDNQIDKAELLAKEYEVDKVYANLTELLDKESIDVLDIITPPPTHYDLVIEAAKRGIHVICQKPLAPSIEMAKAMLVEAESHGIRFMVHENFRFQPWYRKVKEILDAGTLGDRLFNLNFSMRMGDGWPEDAYLSRQPYFREMERLLIYETGIHFIDTFRFLAGEVKSVFASLKKLNPDIKGEDAGTVFFEFENGAHGLWDGNRYNESNFANPRYTFGEMLVEGSGGTLRLHSDGTLTKQLLGKPEETVDYYHKDVNFSGDCVFYTQRHFTDCFLNDLPFENSGQAYLRNLEVQEAVYESAEKGERKMM